MKIQISRAERTEGFKKSAMSERYPRTMSAPTDCLFSTDSSILDSAWRRLSKATPDVPSFPVRATRVLAFTLVAAFCTYLTIVSMLELATDSLITTRTTFCAEVEAVKSVVNCSTRVANSSTD